MDVYEQYMTPLHSPGFLLSKDNKDKILFSFCNFHLPTCKKIYILIKKKIAYTFLMYL